MAKNKYLEIFDNFSPMARESEGAQKPAPGKRVKEDVVKTIWMQQPWAPYPIRDVKGNLIEIVSPGWLNGSAGPDFKNALFKIGGGDIQKGDVEIHVRSSDWEHHKHHRDPAYNNVMLHVVLFCDLAHSSKTTVAGRALIEIELDPICRDAVDQIRSETAIDPGQADMTKITGKCGEEFAVIGAKKTYELIEAAGSARLLLKSNKYHSAIRKGSGADSLYQGLFEAFGYQAYKTRFAKLSKKVPVDELKMALEGVDRLKRPIVLQSALFGVAGLLPEPAFTQGVFDSETEHYVGQLIESWQEVERKSGLRREFGHDEWKTGSTRPANLPTGRLAGIAHFLSLHVDSDLTVLFTRALDRFPIDGKVKDKREQIEKIAKLFPSPESDYWARRYIFGGKLLMRPRKLVGIDRVALIVINVLLPYALAMARSRSNSQEEEMTRKIFAAMPRQTNNSIVKFMSLRVCGNVMNERELTNSAHRQQGLMQIYSDFCIASANGCSDCRFATYLGKLKV